MHTPSLAEYASRLGVDATLLHEIVVAAKNSDSTVIRYGSRVFDAKGNDIGTGCNHDAKTDLEKEWADSRGILHSEKDGLRDATEKGHDIRGARIYLGAISPAADPVGHLILRTGDHVPCFSCSSCAPKLAEQGVVVNLLHGARGWSRVDPKEVMAQGAYATERELATGRKVRGGNIPGSSRKEPPLGEPGYEFDAYPVRDLDQIRASLSPEQEKLYQGMGRLELALPKAWSRETSSYGETTWSEANPAAGQCAVTAALVQKVLGGSVVRVLFEDQGIQDSHYLNILPDGQRVDFTYRQFSNRARFQPSLDSSNEELIANTADYLRKKGFEGPAHEYILSFPKTKERYDHLERAYEAQQRPESAQTPRQPLDLTAARRPSEIEKDGDSPLKTVIIAI